MKGNRNGIGIEIEVWKCERSRDRVYVTMVNEMKNKVLIVCIYVTI